MMWWSSAARSRAASRAPRRSRARRAKVAVMDYVKPSRRRHEVAGFRRHLRQRGLHRPRSSCTRRRRGDARTRRGGRGRRPRTRNAACASGASPSAATSSGRAACWPASLPQRTARVRLDANTLKVTDKKGKVTQITSARFVVAVGGRPNKFDIHGVACTPSIRDTFRWRLLLPIGAGYIAWSAAASAMGWARRRRTWSISHGVGANSRGVDKIQKHLVAHGVNLQIGVTPTDREGRRRAGRRCTAPTARRELRHGQGATGRKADTTGRQAAAVPGAAKDVAQNGKLKAVDEQLAARGRTSTPLGTVLGRHAPEVDARRHRGAVCARARRVFGSGNGAHGLRERAPRRLHAPGSRRHRPERGRGDPTWARENERVLPSSSRP